MAKKWSNLNLPGALHFVTGATLGRRSAFSDSENCELFLGTLAKLKEEWPSKIIAYVLMPDHFHLICNPQDGGIREFAGKLKSLSARSILSDAPESQLWQESFKALPLWSGYMIWQKIHYIHGNPLKAKLCTATADYRWSSFRTFYKGVDEPLQVDQDWWWPGDVEKLENAGRELGWKGGRP
jgi:putative transposase